MHAKTKAQKRLFFSVAACALLITSPMITQASDLPTGGQIVAGSGNISQSGATVTIQQDSAKMVADWQNFSIGKGHTVNFQQPSANAIALNRVLGSDISVIQGAINANGRIFLVNPNGVTFTPDAQINTGGLVASTLNLRTDDFLAGNYSFQGNSENPVINQGTISTTGGTVALIAAKVINEGTIEAHSGNILIGAGSKIILDLGGPVKLEIEEGAIETLIEQGGALRANGGTIYLTAKAAGELATSVINHTGISEAKTLSTGKKGEIILLGDMDIGLTKVAGELNATAPSGGDGGFIETSAANVDIQQNTIITAGSTHGKGGLWLIDPFDYIINDAAAGNIASTLNTGTDVTIQTTVNNASLGSTGAGANGNIKVASTINKTAGGEATLTLEAENVIDLAAPITSTNGALNLILRADSDANGSGVIIATKGTSLNGGNLGFGIGDTATFGGVSTLVGGDLYVGGEEQVVFRTGGGNIELFGELIIANPDGVKFITDNGNAHFHGIINGGNKYERITNGGVPYTWLEAFEDAKNGTAGGDAIGDSYLATVTSRLENAVVVYTGELAGATQLAHGAWLGGQRVTGIGTDQIWRWVAGPEGLADDGNGLPFYNGSHFSSGSAVGDSFINWQTNEPNNAGGSEDRVQIGDQFGRWNDLPNTSGLNQRIYIRETNYGDADLEIDAGTGTVTFEKEIGGLKGINYVAYDVSNPNPTQNNPPTTTTGTTVPQKTAISSVQSTTNPPQQTKSQTSYTSYSFTAPSSSGGTSSNTTNTFTNVGTMQIVQLTAEQGNSMESINESSNSGINGIGQQAELTGPTKVFVVQGGVRLPAGTDQDNEE